MGGGTGAVDKRVRLIKKKKTPREKGPSWEVQNYETATEKKGHIRGGKSGSGKESGVETLFRVPGLKGVSKDPGDQKKKRVARERTWNPFLEP